MTTARQIIGMIRSHAVGDNERFLSIAEEIANEALRAGKNRVGEDIHNLLANVRANPRENSTQLQPTPLAKPRGELAFGRDDSVCFGRFGNDFGSRRDRKWRHWAERRHWFGTDGKARNWPDA